MNILMPGLEGGQILFLISGLFICFSPSAVPPSVSGICDNKNFHILVKYGNQGFQTLVGKRVLSSTLAKRYDFKENGTHFSIAVPLFAPDVIFEVQSEFVMSELWPGFIINGLLFRRLRRHPSVVDWR